MFIHNANRLTLAVANSVRTTYTNDAAGNRTGMQPQGHPSTIYNWDAAGRMVAADAEAGIATFTYNADGQRSAKQGTDASVVGYLYDYKRLDEAGVVQARYKYTAFSQVSAVSIDGGAWSAEDWNTLRSRPVMFLTLHSR